MAMARTISPRSGKSAGYMTQLPIQRITWQDAMDDVRPVKPRVSQPACRAHRIFPLQDTHSAVFQPTTSKRCRLRRRRCAAPRVVSDARQEWR